MMELTAEEFRPGFDWVAREVVATNAQREALFSVVHGNLYEGMNTRLKLLSAAWPHGAVWPSGIEFLQEQLRLALEDEEGWQEGDPLPDARDSDVFKLLLMRFSQVAQRLYRNQQIRESYADETFRRRRPFMVMNREPCEEHAFCGRDSGVKLSAEEGLRLMDELACGHPACRCTFDPAKI